MKSIQFPETKSDYYPMRGGLNLVTPAIEKNPGQCDNARNYEPKVGGGYRRIDGFERSDGRPSPSDASYWLIEATVTGTVTVGATLTGATSAATGKVLGEFSGDIVLGRVTGTFASGEALQITAVTVATANTVAMENGADDSSDHADYRLLAADDRRADILAVPGSGNCRGGFVLNDICYAFRDNAGATAGDLYKQTAGGWVQVAFGKEIQFTGAVGQVSAGQTVTGATSAATGVVVRALLRTGTWTVSGVGTLILSGVTGTFQSGEALQVGGVTKVTSSSLCTNITRAVGGRVETVKANFTGSLATERIYGADGVNLAFEFDGTNYIPIRTGMVTDTPLHIAFHLNRLWLTFLGSLQNCSVGDPYGWTVVTGANEIAMGEVITGILSLSGNSTATALGVFTRNQTSVLYGSTSSTFQLVPFKGEVGYRAYTLQSVGNDTFGLTANGIQSLKATQDFGNYSYAALSFPVQPLIEAYVRDQVSATAAVSLKAKSQYRVYFDDNSALVFGLTGNKVSGIMALDYGIPVLTMWSDTLSTGEQVAYFSTTGGMVYKDNVGTSFDGEPIEAFIRPAFNNLKSPLVRKTYRAAEFEVAVEGYCEVNASYDIGYATPEVSAAATQEDQALRGAGGYWDEFTWDEFTWDSRIVNRARLSIDGTETNITFLFYSNRAQDDSHTVQGVSLLYTPRRLVHSGT